MVFADPVQLLIIGAIAVVVLMWGPTKIPQLARSLGRAKNEFEMGGKETAAPVAGHPEAEVGSPDALRNTAKQLGISTEGKTSDQISAEIVQRVKKFS